MIPAVFDECAEKRVLREEIVRADPLPGPFSLKSLWQEFSLISSDSPLQDNLQSVHDIFLAGA